MPPTLTPSPGQPSHLEHLRNFCLHQVKGYSRKAAPGLDIFDKAELGSGIPVPSPFSAELRCSPAWGRVMAPVLPLLRKHPVPYLGRRLFFNFLEHLNRARQGWCAKGHPWRGGEAAGRSSPHIEERAVQEVVQELGSHKSLACSIHPQSHCPISLARSRAPDPFAII